MAVSGSAVTGLQGRMSPLPLPHVVRRLSWRVEWWFATGQAPVSKITVLGAHTAEHVTRIYDYFAARQMPMRILPLFDGPSEREVSAFALDHEGQRRAMEALFRHWLETGCRIRVDPLMSYFRAALRHMAGVAQPIWKRELHGDSTFIVNTDGMLYRPLDAYEEGLALGRLGCDRIASILQSPAYQVSLARDREEFSGRCQRCPYLGACNGAALYASRVTSPYEGLCPSAHASISFMIRYLNECGYGEADIRRLLEGLRAASSAATAA